MKMEIDLIVTDMDGTAVQYPVGDFSSSWDALSGVLSEDERKKWFSLQKEYCGKQELYNEWFSKQAELLKGKKLSDAEKYLFPIPYSPGFKEFFGSSNGLKKAILSAGIDIVAKRIAKDFNFDYWIAQHIEVEEGVFTGKGDSFADFDKAEFLLEIIKHLDVSLLKTCYVGDTSGDINCLELVGMPVAFNPAHGLEDYVKAKKIFCISDFRELNQILKS
jgi:phosphoserine phosphatase